MRTSSIARAPGHGTVRARDVILMRSDRFAALKLLISRTGLILFIFTYNDFLLYLKIRPIHSISIFKTDYKGLLASMVSCYVCFYMTVN